MPALLLLSACIGLTPVPGQDKGDDDGGGTTVGGLSVDPGEVDFGEVSVGASAERTVALENTGGEVLYVEATLRDEGVFTLDTTAVEVTDTRVLTLGFAPTSAEAYEGALTLSVGGGDTLELPVLGTGVADGTETDPPDPTGELDVTPGRYDFGQVDLGDTAVATFTVENTGDADLLVSDVTVDDRQFTVGGQLSPPQVLAPGASKEVEVTFAPTAEGTASASLVVASDAGDATVSLSGEGVDRCDICTPILEVDTGGSDDHKIDDFFSFMGAADAHTVTLRNVGDVDLVVSDVTVKNDLISTCGAFTLGGWRGSVTLGAYESTSFTISYTATDTCLEVAYPGLDANVAHILSNDPAEGDWVVELSGAGL